VLPALIAFVVPFVVYAGSLPSGPDGWDNGEAQTVPYILGIFHPTGFPLYTLAGWAFTHGLPLSTVAWRMNLLSALATATTCVAIAVLARGFGAWPWTALAGALVFAFVRPVWHNAVHAEVHAFLVATLALMLVALQRAIALRSPRWYVAAAALAGCGVAVHLNAVWTLPGLALGALPLARVLRVRGVLAAAGAFIVPVLTYAYLPLRGWYIAAHGIDPNVAPPLDGTGSLVWGMYHPQTWSGFVRETSGADIGATNYALHAVDPRLWPSYAAAWLTQARLLLTSSVVVLALIGLFVVARRRFALLAVVVAGCGAIPFAVAYRSVEEDLTRYIFVSLVTACALAPVAAEIVSDRRLRVATNALVGATLLLAASSAYLTNLNISLARTDRSGDDLIAFVRDNTPDGAVVMASWLDATTLSYGREVEKALGSRIVCYMGWPADGKALVRRLSRTKRIFVDADFSERGELSDLIPASWRHLRATMADHQLVEIVPAR
jgi:hypothetical protein